ncbi:hypothetical protein CARN8_3320006 [mine drainage metagenome]|uniref:Uncharacterized protein n=1 Tax=mine drainage metagenome TaxID=410659 RepID=A0A3P3ZNZ5_9ZZZZ
MLEYYKQYLCQLFQCVEIKQIVFFSHLYISLMCKKT